MLIFAEKKTTFLEKNAILSKTKIVTSFSIITCTHL